MTRPVLAHRALSDRLQDGVVNLGPMTRDELQAVMQRPAEKVGLTFEKGLAERILRRRGRGARSLAFT